jgi:predicted RNA-binding protein with PUA-like domain
MAQGETSMAYWLMKSEPHVYSWDDLVRDKATDWDGVRNNAARLHLRAMQPGDEAFFYHSGDEKAVVGIMTITGPGKPDGEDGAWVKVPVAPVRKLPPVTLKAIKAETGLAQMELVRQSRLSVSPVRDAEWAKVLEMAK